MKAEPQRALRRLVDFNPAPVKELRQSSEMKVRLLPMDAVQNFGPPHDGVTRRVSEVLQGYSYVEPQDVAYAKVTPCFENGKGLLGADLERPVFATSELTVLRPKSELNQRFLSYVLRSESFRGPAIASMTGAGGLKRVDETAMKTHKIWCPPLSSQRAIADYLDHETAEIDAFIADQEELSRILHERELSLLEQQFREASTKWVQLKRLGLDRVGGYSANASARPAEMGEVGVLKAGAVSKGFFDPAQNKAVEDAHEIARLQTPVLGGTLIVNRANTPSLVGSLAYVKEDHPGLFLSDLLWRVTVRKVHPELLAFYAKTKHYQECIERISVGASSTMKKIRFGDFANLSVPLPPEEDAQQILVELREAFESLREIQGDAVAAIALAKERRAVLISAAVTGQIDVTAKHKPAAEQLEDEVQQLT